MFRLIVAGTRTFKNYELLRRKLDELLINQPEIEIVSGTAKGADTLGEQYAKERGHTIIQFPADWNKYAKAAGYIRNKRMAEYAASGKELGGCVCFWDGQSRGTKHMIDLAIEYKLNLRIIRY